jgi:hypothetical protein
VISWNEYSENSEIEPTVAFGTRYLSTVADLTGRDFVFHGNFDSSSAPASGPGYTAEFFVGGLAVLLASFAAVAWRRQVKRAVERHH